MSNTLDNNCEFCSKEWIGYVSMPDGSLPWVCEDHWDMYAEKTRKPLGTDKGFSQITIK